MVALKESEKMTYLCTVGSIHSFCREDSFIKKSQLNINRLGFRNLGGVSQSMLFVHTLPTYENFVAFFRFATIKQS
ncbi:MAG: hypothetical protein EZS26_003825 [Candidatus Ordinivivax streblomastigis]|uniref:Uncharacterized protein n=1 Tax=Candidatus Ordinivivax streblomastigis TaxID=2540710 RepID=A0A5M8NXX8_9BACT|nr:MAG: hypothetical protein EZS26_003825 [Candidatus Ordinivivax streblomastigis]